MKNEEQLKKAVIALADFQEVAVKVVWDDGTTQEVFFDSCEDAWFWEADQKRVAKSRRAKADRKYIMSAIYAGCTALGSTYGGVLSGTASKYDVSEYEFEQFIRAKKHCAYKGVKLTKEENPVTAR